MARCADEPWQSLHDLYDSSAWQATNFFGLVRPAYGCLSAVLGSHPSQFLTASLDLMTQLPSLKP